MDLELQFAFKQNLANNLTFVQEEIVIRCESLKDELDQLRDACNEEVNRTEKEIY